RLAEAAPGAGPELLNSLADEFEIVPAQQPARGAKEFRIGHGGHRCRIPEVWNVPDSRWRQNVAAGRSRRRAGVAPALTSKARSVARIGATAGGEIRPVGAGILAPAGL